MRSRTAALEFSLLALLSQGNPHGLHGYELRKRLIAIYGPFRALSFSVLYPQLRRMLEAGLIEESKLAAPALSRRSRIIYAISSKGKKHFAALTSQAGPDDWDDESFEVRFAFFSPTPPTNRLQILEGRHRRLVDKAEVLRSEIARSPKGGDKYLTEWRNHSLDSIEREIIWLEEMKKNERES